MPGPPFGPSYRITTTSPATISPLVTASKAPLSPSKTLAGPSCFSMLVPATFITAPSGAKLPFNIANPPVELLAFCTEKITLSSGFVDTFSKFSSRVLPFIDLAFPCIKPALSNSFMTTCTPPDLSTSDITNCPPGLKSVRYGVSLLMLSKSSIDRSTSASLAIANRCNTAFVDPPIANTRRIAFSKASLVIMSRGFIPFSSIE